MIIVMVVAMMLKYILTLSPLIVIVIVAMTLRYIVYLDLEDGVRMGQDKGIFPRFFAVPNIPSPEIAKYRLNSSLNSTHPWSIIGPASTGGRMYLVDSLSNLVDSLRTGEGSCCLRKGRRRQWDFKRLKKGKLAKQ